MRADPTTAPHPATPAVPTVAVVGGGIAGLAAAWELVTSAAVRVLVLEGAPRVGGKLALTELGGVVVDAGAESLLARRPEAVELARQVGLAADLEAPRPVGAGLWLGERRVGLPSGTLMGVPSSAESLDGLVDAAALDAVRHEPARHWPPLDDDVDVASFVTSRVGPAVVDRLVEPLLGGVYAGHATRLSLQATVPALWDAAHEGRSAVLAARAAAEAGAATQGPVFTGLRGGVGRLPVAVLEALEARGASVRTGTTVRAVLRHGGGWRLVTGPTSDERAWDVDGVVLAVPAAPAARLLTDVAPAAARELRAVEYASVALVSLLLARHEVAGLDGSGLLVPPSQGRYVKATTFSSSKWAWLDDADRDHVVVRASVGRYGQEHDLQVDDDEIVRRALADLRAIPGVRLPDPAASLVTRWGGGLPQYAVGHLARVERVRADVGRSPALAVAGAAYAGVGIPACVASGRRAAREVLDEVTQVLGRSQREGQ